MSSDAQVTDAELAAAINEATRSPALTTWADLDDSIFSPVGHSSDRIARLLLPGGLSTLPIDSREQVVFLPTTESAIVVPSDRAAAVARAAELVEFFIDPATQISLLPIVGNDGKWRPFEPSPDHPAHDPWRHLLILDRAIVADAQRSALELISRSELHVAPLLTIQVGNSLHTACSWTQGIETLLPEADIVGLTDSNGEVRFLVPWEAVARLVSHRLFRTGHNPPRWLTVDFPNEDELDALEIVRLGAID